MLRAGPRGVPRAAPALGYPCASAVRPPWAGNGSSRPAVGGREAAARPGRPCCRVASGHRGISPVPGQGLPAYGTRSRSFEAGPPCRTGADARRWSGGGCPAGAPVPPGGVRGAALRPRHRRAGPVAGGRGPGHPGLPPRPRTAAVNGVDQVKRVSPRASSGLRALLAYGRSRNVPRAALLAPLIAVAATVQCAGQQVPLPQLRPLTACSVPLAAVVPVALAVVLAAATFSPMADLEHITAQPMRRHRVVHMTAALLHAALPAVPPRAAGASAEVTVAAVRDVAGRLGLARPGPPLRQRSGLTSSAGDDRPHPAGRRAPGQHAGTVGPGPFTGRTASRPPSRPLRLTAAHHPASRKARRAGGPDRSTWSLD